MEFFRIFVVKEWGGVRSWSVLALACGGDSEGRNRVWRILWETWLVIEPFYEVGNVIGHGDIDILVVVMPLEVEATEVAASPVDGGDIFVLEGIEEVQSVCLCEVFDCKVINT